MSGDDDEWTVDDEQFESSAERETAEDSSADTVEEDDEWRFSLSDLEDDEETSEESDEDEVGGNVFGSIQGAAEELEAGTPSKENAFFVVVGVVLALLFFAQFLLVIVSG